MQLLARIERMERRVQLVKKDSEREKHRIFQGFEVDEKPEAEACEKLPLECPQDLLEPPPTLQPKHFPYGRNGKGHKRLEGAGGGVAWSQGEPSPWLHPPSVGLALEPLREAAWHRERIAWTVGTGWGWARSGGRPKTLGKPLWPLETCLQPALAQQPWIGGAGGPGAGRGSACPAELLFLPQEADVRECGEEDAR